MTTNPALSPRKKPRQSRSKATVDAIIEAAAQVLASHGLVGFNTNIVAQRAGVSIGSLYQYFPNKDALMVALIHRQQQGQQGALAQAIVSTKGQSLPDMVRALVRAAMQHHYDNALLATAIDHEEARLPIQSDLDFYLVESGQWLLPLFMRYGDQIDFHQADTAARTLPALVRAVVDAWANQTPPQLQTAENEAVRCVLGYLRINDHSINPLLSIES
jgi:AcrR family transcriptional regulator